MRCGGRWWRLAEDEWGIFGVVVGCNEHRELPGVILILFDICGHL